MVDCIGQCLVDLGIWFTWLAEVDLGLGNLVFWLFGELG